MQFVSKIAALLLITFGVSGCAMFKFENVKAWEKGALASDEMMPGGDKVDNYIDSHIYFSKEASTGGTGVGGGGCGCN